MEVLLYMLHSFKTIFCAMLCVYAFKQLVGENEIDNHLSAQNLFGNIVFLTFNMNEMQHQQNNIWFKGKNL